MLLVDRVLVVLRAPELLLVLRVPLLLEDLAVDLPVPLELLLAEDLLADDLEALLDLLAVVRLAVLPLLPEVACVVFFWPPLLAFAVLDFLAVLPDRVPELRLALALLAPPDLAPVLVLVVFFAVDLVPLPVVVLRACDDCPVDLVADPLVLPPCFWPRLLRTSALIRLRVSSRICRLSRALSMIRSTVP